MEFFVPHAEGDDESAFAELAEFAGRQVPPPGKRVASIEWVHDGEDWVAVVGRTLRGTRTRVRQQRGQRREVTQNLRDSATVLAIFPGAPYIVVTDARPLGTVVSYWANPFLAGQPRTVHWFTA